MSAKVQVDKYFDALQRLIDRGEPISKASVAVEAGSKPGCCAMHPLATPGALLVEARSDSEPSLAPKLRGCVH